LARGRLLVIPRGTDLARFAPAAIERARVTRLRESWGVAPHERVVLLAARLTEWKGQRVLIEAARLMKERGFADVRCILAGDAQGRDSYARDLDARIRKSGLEGLVARVGHCHDMPAALVAASVVAVPSTAPEAFGRSAVEGQAMGAMVVVSDSGAASETVLAPPQTSPQARTGWRVPPGDAPALAEALMSALTLGATARDAIAQRARAHVEANFSLEQMTEKTLAAYRAALTR